MSSLISQPFRPVLNLRGTFEAGARLTVYRADTTTLYPIYSDQSLTIPLANPLVADGYGTFPPIYYDEEQIVRVLIEDSQGAALFDLNPYISSSFEAENILEQATLQVANAAQHAAEAEASKEAASAIEATVEALVGPTYASTAAGLSATTNGQFFAVVVGDVVSIYLNSSGTALLQRSILSATAVQTALDAKADFTHTHTIANVNFLEDVLDSKAPLESPSFTGTPVYDSIEIGYRDIPRKAGSGALIASDRGKCIAANGGVTIPSGVFAAGAAVTIYNDTASSVTITQGGGLTLRLAATSTTGNRTLAARGIATVWFNSSTEAIISGSGVT